MRRREGERGGGEGGGGGRGERGGGEGGGGEGERRRGGRRKTEERRRLTFHCSLSGSSLAWHHSSPLPGQKRRWVQPECAAG